MLSITLGTTGHNSGMPLPVHGQKEVAKEPDQDGLGCAHQFNYFNCVCSYYFCFGSPLGLLLCFCLGSLLGLLLCFCLGSPLGLLLYLVGLNHLILGMHMVS